MNVSETKAVLSYKLSVMDKPVDRPSDSLSQISGHSPRIAMNPYPHDRVVEQMEVNGRTVLVCNCEGTMPLDGAKLAKACDASTTATPATQLCRAELDRFIAA